MVHLDASSRCTNEHGLNLKDIKTGLRTNNPKPLQIDLDEEKEKNKPFVSRNWNRLCKHNTESLNTEDN